MSHMVATSLEELHDMADAIGLRRQWYQGKNTPHYDVCWEKRGAALRAGAISVDRREMADLCRQWRIALDTGCEKIRGVGQLGLDL